MSSLRRVLKKDPIPEEDVEAPNDEGSPTKTSAAASSSDSSSAPTGHDPVFLAKVVFRKVVGLLTSEDEDDGEETAGIISLLRDLVLGTIFGVLMISLFLFLDHRNIMHLESAHRFRETVAVQMVNNPETLATIEETSGLKLIPPDKYESMLNQIKDFKSQKPDLEKKIQAKSDELEAKKKEVQAMKVKHTELWNNPLVGLNKWCGGCTWSGKVTCDGRVAFLQMKYHSTIVDARMNAMSHPACKSN